MFASDDAVFAWAISKALLILIVSVGTLVYAAWAFTSQKPRRNAAQTKSGAQRHAENAIHLLKKSDFNLKTLAIVGQRYHIEDQVVGNYTTQSGRASVVVRGTAEEVESAQDGAG